MEDSYFDALGVDAIVGQPLLLNYYFMVDIDANTFALERATYTKGSNPLTLGAIIFLVEIAIVIILAIIGCVVVYKRNKKEQELIQEKEIEQE